MCVCTRGYQTSHARAITNVGRSQLHRFIAVTADLRRGRDKSKTKKKRGGRKGGEEIEITASRLPRGWWLPSPKWKTRYIMGFSTRRKALCAISRLLRKDSFSLRSSKIEVSCNLRTLVFLSIAMIKDGESLRNETNEKGRISSLAGNFDKEILGESDVETLLD